MDDNIKVLYQNLKADGYDDLGTEEEFRTLLSNESNRKTLYANLRQDGYDDIGDDSEMDSFFGFNAKPEAKKAAPAKTSTQKPAQVKTPAATQKDQAAKSQPESYGPLYTPPTYEETADMRKSMQNVVLASDNEGGKTQVQEEKPVQKTSVKNPVNDMMMTKMVFRVKNMGNAIKQEGKFLQEQAKDKSSVLDTQSWRTDMNLTPQERDQKAGERSMRVTQYAKMVSEAEDKQYDEAIKKAEQKLKDVEATIADERKDEGFFETALRYVKANLFASDLASKSGDFDPRLIEAMAEVEQLKNAKKIKALSSQLHSNDDTGFFGLGFFGNADGSGNFWSSTWKNLGNILEGQWEGTKHRWNDLDFATLGRSTRELKEKEISIKKKDESEWTDEEREFLDTTAFVEAMNGKYRKMLPKSFEFGEMAVDSGLTAVEFLATLPGGGLGLGAKFSAWVAGKVGLKVLMKGLDVGTKKAFSYYLAKYGEKYVKKMMAEALVTTSKYVAGFGEKVGMSAVLSNTIQANQTFNKIAESYLGDLKSGVNEEGRVYAMGFEDGTSLGRAIYEGESKMILENLTELIGGEGATKLMGKLAGLTSKGAGYLTSKAIEGVLDPAEQAALGLAIATVKKATGKAMNNAFGWVNKIGGNSGAMKLLNDVNFGTTSAEVKGILEKAGIHSFTEEVIEEEYNIIGEHLLGVQDYVRDPFGNYVRDENGKRVKVGFLDDITDPDKQMDIVAGMACTMGSMRFTTLMSTKPFTVGHYLYSRRMLGKADATGKQLFGDDWSGIKSALESFGDAELGAGVNALKNGFTDIEKQRAIINYMIRMQDWRGVSLAAKGMNDSKEVNGLRAALMDAAEQGYDMETAQQRANVKRALDCMNQYLTGEGGTNIDDILSQYSSPEEAVRSMEGVMSKEDMNFLLQYISTKAAYDGMVARVQDDIEGQIQRDNAAIDSVTRQDGTTVSVTLKDPNGNDVLDQNGKPLTYFVSDGEIAFDENGNVDAENTDQTLIIKDLNGNMQMVSKDNIGSLVSQMNAEAAKAANEQETRAAMAQARAEEIAGRVQFMPGNTYNVNTGTIRVDAIDDEGNVTYSYVNEEGQPISTPVTTDQASLEFMVQNYEGVAVASRVVEVATGETPQVEEEAPAAPVAETPAAPVAETPAAPVEETPGPVVSGGGMSSAETETPTTEEPAETPEPAYSPAQFTLMQAENRLQNTAQGASLIGAVKDTLEGDGSLYGIISGLSDQETIDAVRAYEEAWNAAQEEANAAETAPAAEPVGETEAPAETVEEAPAAETPAAEETAPEEPQAVEEVALPRTKKGEVDFESIIDPDPTLEGADPVNYANAYADQFGDQEALDDIEQTIQDLTADLEKAKGMKNRAASRMKAKEISGKIGFLSQMADTVKGRIAAKQTENEAPAGETNPPAEGETQTPAAEETAPSAEEVARVERERAQLVENARQKYDELYQRLIQDPASPDAQNLINQLTALVFPFRNEMGFDNCNTIEDVMQEVNNRVVLGAVNSGMTIDYSRMRDDNLSSNIISYQHMARKYAKQGKTGLAEAYDNLVTVAINEFKKRGLTGKNLKLKSGVHTDNEIRNIFYSLNCSDETRALFELLWEKIDGLGVNWLIDNRLGPSTGGSNTGSRIRYNMKWMNSEYLTDQRKAELMCHEMLHQVTSYAMYFVEHPSALKSLNVTLDENVAAAVHQLKNIFNEVRNAELLQKEDGSKNASKEYGTTSDREFLAEYANSSFREKLRQLGLFEAFVDAIKKLLGINVDPNTQTTAEKKLSECVETFLENFDSSAHSAYVRKQDAIRKMKESEKEAYSDFEGVEEDMSVDTMVEPLGLYYSKGEDGRTEFRRLADDSVVTEITEEMVKESGIGTIIRNSPNMTQEKMDAQIKVFTQMYNTMMRTNNLDMIYAVSGFIGFHTPVNQGERDKATLDAGKDTKVTGYTGNADKQYSSTIDFTTICLKTQAIIDAMSQVMVRLKSGLSESEIVNIVYKNTHQAGEPVPCPVCYVFARWVGLGGLFDRMYNLQNKYANADVATLRAEVKRLDNLINEIKGRRNAEVEAALAAKAEKSGKPVSTDKLTGTEAIKELRKMLEDRISVLNQAMAMNHGKLGEQGQKEFDQLKQDIEILDSWSWIKNVRLDPKYKPVPAEVLFDINAGKRFMEEYPLSWKFRTTRGCAMGKAATPYSPLHLGQVLYGMGMSKIGAEQQRVLGRQQNNPFLKSKGGVLTAAAVKRLKKAQQNARIQNLLNGQRYQSTSDFRFEFALDYILSFLEMQAAGSKVQLYTKVPEAIPLFAAMGAEVNCSIMPKGNGYVINPDGTIELRFSRVTGMDERDAFAYSNQYDNVQPILVGVNDIHIRTALADPRITFLIPYHRSGAGEARYNALMDAIGEREDKMQTEDYSPYQSDKEIPLDAIKDEVERARVETSRNLRQRILTGKQGKQSWNPGKLTDSEKEVLKNNPYLESLLERFWGVDVNGNEVEHDADCYGVRMNKDRASQIFPYEYWDTSLNIEQADQNGERFKEYCATLGIVPRFSGRTSYDAEVKHEKDFSSMPGYWKTLIDRKMYNNDSTYHQQKAIDVTEMDMTFIDPVEMREQVQYTPSKVNDPAKVKDIAEKSIQEVSAEREKNGTHSFTDELAEEMQLEEDEKKGEWNDPVTPDEVTGDEFKAVFGDWQNNPAEASKVVNEDGTPKIVFHGSPYGGIKVFDPSQGESSGLKRFGSYFTDNRNLAEFYANGRQLTEELRDKILTDIERLKIQQNNVRTVQEYESYQAEINSLTDALKGKVYPVYLNIRNPKEFDAKGKDGWSGWHELKQDVGYDVKSGAEAVEAIKGENDAYEPEENWDGIIAHNIVDIHGDAEANENLRGNVYLVWDPKSVIFATEQQPVGLDDAMSLEEDYKRTAEEEPSELEAEQFYTRQYLTGDTMNVDGGELGLVATNSGAARRAYERDLAKSHHVEAWQDSMISLKILQDAVAKASGRKVEDWQNAYLAENRLSSMNRAEIDLFRATAFKELLEAVKDLGGARKSRYEGIIKYMIAKHGLERNEFMARRDAERDFAKNREHYKQKLQEKLSQAEATIQVLFTKAQTEELTPEEEEALQNANIASTQLRRTLSSPEEFHDDVVEMLYMDKYRKRDYSGLTGTFDMDTVEEAEREAQEYLNFFEENASAEAIDNLWSKINACTKMTLSKAMESGLIDRDTYDNIRGMYQYYIPLRGWYEETSEEVYDYIGRDLSHGTEKTMQKAKGRSSRADDPLANIGAMAESAIAQGNRNVMKQHFLSLAENHPSDVISVNEAVMHLDESTGEWSLVTPDEILPAGEITDERVKQVMEVFNARIKELMEEDPDHYKSASSLRKMKNAQGTGVLRPNIPYKVKNSVLLARHQVQVRRGGKLYILTINGVPRAAEALNGETSPEVKDEGISAGMQWINRQMAANFTTRNPAFVMANLCRDGIYAGLSVWVKESPRYAGKFNKNWWYTLGVMGSLIRKYNNGTLDESDETERLFKEFMANGGETGYSFLTDKEGYKTRIEADLRRLTSGGVINAAYAVGETLETFNRWAEGTSRFAAYMTSRETGRSIAKSIYDAKEISVNFNKKGSGASTAGKLEKGNLVHWTSAQLSQFGRNNFVFWNAGIQGLTNFGKMAAKHPGKFATLAGGLIGFGAVVPFINIMMMNAHGDGDGEKRYYNIPEYIRRSNICWMLGDNVITIPLPVEFRSLYGLGELMMDCMCNGELYTPQYVAMKAAEQVTQILPINFLEGGGFKLRNFVPSYAAPIYDIHENTSWTGVPLQLNDTQWNKNMPQWTKAYSTTNKTAVSICRTLNEWTRGNDAKKGWADVVLSPAKLTYFFEAYFGGPVKAFNRVINLGSDIVGNKEYEHKDLPIANRFLTTADERAHEKRVNELYYSLNDEMTAWGDEYRYHKSVKDSEGEGISSTEDYTRILNRFHDLENSYDKQVYEAYNIMQKALKEYRDLCKKAVGSIPQEALRKTETEIKEDIVRTIRGMQSHPPKKEKKKE